MLVKGATGVSEVTSMNMGQVDISIVNAYIAAISFQYVLVFPW